MKTFSMKSLPRKYLAWMTLSLLVFTLYLWWTNVRFGDTFPHPLQSKNIELECSFNGNPICCGLMKDNSAYGVQHKVAHNGDARVECFTTRTYEASPYEIRHVQKAVDLALISEEKQRRDELLVFMFDDIPSSNIWLERIRIRMLSAVPTIVPTEEDWEFLSRFAVTEHCTLTKPHSGVATNTVHTWYEWIEPLTVHMRHPFGFTECFSGWNPQPYWVGAFQDRAASMKFPASLVHGDYVLLQSHHDHRSDKSGFYDSNKREAPRGTAASRAVNYSSAEKNLRSAGSSASQLVAQEMQGAQRAQTLPLGTKNEPSAQIKSSLHAQSYFFDAGTSTFDSGLFWFVCGYLQHNIRFDQIFGWEVTLLEPNNFWSRVPPLLVPYYHFLNTPISAEPTSPQSVLRVIKQVAREEDFVALKLDIDTPEVEIPIVQQLVADAALHRLVDEFFFELHFRCEILMHCGWKDQMPTEYQGLRLDRPHAMQLFTALRTQGIRAHVWP